MGLASDAVDESNNVILRGYGQVDGAVAVYRSGRYVQQDTMG